MPKLLRIHLKSPWSHEFTTQSAIFSSEIPLADADAILCDWQPHDSILSYEGPKAWYCCEPPNQFRTIDKGTWPRFRRKLGDNFFLSHDHPNPLCRIPHVTHFQDLTINRNLQRDHLAVSIVSNHGGSPLYRTPSVNFRNHFITHSLVDLYGRQSWKHFRKNWYSRASFPSNYKGELPGDWHQNEKRRLMSKYRFAICLENEPSPFYFTEKFVEAVCAGCIPIYQSHQSLRDNVLHGAMWVEPKRNIEETLEYCDKIDQEEVQSKNEYWIRHNTHLQNTSIQRVYEKIETYFRIVRAYPKTQVE
jgi:hypothetical protein